jgi:hypothetical protein
VIGANRLTLCSERRHRTRSPSRRSRPGWPSRLRYATSSSLRNRISTTAESGTTSGRCVSECGATGVITNAFTVGINHGAARGERVSGRTRGRGHDHAIGAVAGDEYLVDKEVVIIQTSQSSLVDHGVVENQVASQNLFAAQQITLHQRTLLHGGAALRDRSSMVNSEASGTSVRKPSDPRFTPSSGASLRPWLGRGEQSAVAAQHHDQVQGPRRHLRARHFLLPLEYFAVSGSTMTS